MIKTWKTTTRQTKRLKRSKESSRDISTVKTLPENQRIEHRKCYLSMIVNVKMILTRKVQNLWERDRVDRVSFLSRSGEQFNLTTA